MKAARSVVSVASIAGRVIEEALYRMRTLGCRGGDRKLVPSGQRFFKTDRQSPLAAWRFLNEDEPRIRDRAIHRKLVGMHCAVRVPEDSSRIPLGVTPGADGDILVHRRTAERDAWVYMYLDPREHSWIDYRWSFGLRMDSPFQELQIAFRYRDFYNRYRFRIESGNASLDVVRNGRFYNRREVAPIDLELGKWNYFQIDVCGKYFVLRVNDTTVLRGCDPAAEFKSGSIGVIFWENAGRCPIRAAIGPSLVEGLSFESKSGVERRRC